MGKTAVMEKQNIIRVVGKRVVVAFKKHGHNCTKEEIARFCVGKETSVVVTQKRVAKKASKQIDKIPGALTLLDGKCVIVKFLPGN